MTEFIKNNEYKIIRISQKNYDILNSLGQTNDTFNTVLTRILKENNDIGIANTEDKNS
jgi:hypothetical protein